MDDPVYTLPFLKKVILERQKDIIGIAVSKGDRLTIGKKRSKIVYLFSLLLIMGPVYFIKYSLVETWFKFNKIVAGKTGFVASPSILTYANDLDIPTFEVQSVNNKNFLKELKNLEPDVIINQAQNILKQDFLSIPSIGVINRHNALLPRNRGRLTPFWVLYKKEKETGVSIHFVNEGIDSGDIIVQERFSIKENDTFNSIVEKNYQIAPLAMLKALEILERGEFQLIENDDEQATYNTVPTFREALQFRLGRIFPGK